MSTDLAALLRTVVDGSEPALSEVRRVLADDPDAAAAVVDLGRRMSALQQRSAELRAVVASTKDLLEIRDPSTLLQRIVDRAHDLIDIHITYLSVYDPERDELYVRAASGTISQRFLDMVVPAGVGLASLAVRTRQPQWVDDYSGLTSVPHDPTIDAVVAEEQLRSLLGAPLVVGDEVLGVLFAASRDARAFRADEISLLVAFAGHAALVLHLAQLLQKATDATAEAATRQGEAEWAAALHSELTRLVVYGHGADAVVGALAEALGRRVALVDGAGQRISVSGGDDPAVEWQHPGERWLARVMRDAENAGTSVVADHSVIELVAPVMASMGRPGAILIERGERLLTPVERRTVERSALTAALLTLRRDALIDAEERVRGELAAELLEGGDLRRSALGRAVGRGYPVDGPWVVCAVPIETDNDRASVMARLRSHADWLVARGAEGATVLVPGETTEAAAAVHHVAVGHLLVYEATESLEAAAAAAAGVWQAARLAVGLGGASGAVNAATFAPYASLFDGDGQRARALIDDVLSPVLEWDAQHGTELLATLAVLFDEHWSLARAARSAHVHVNTLKQRVQRLRALLGDRLDAPESRFRVELAVRAEAARRVLLTPGV